MRRRTGHVFRPKFLHRVTGKGQYLSSPLHMPHDSPSQRYSGASTPDELDRFLVAKERCKELGLPELQCDNEMLAPVIDDDFRARIRALVARELPQDEACALYDMIWRFKSVREYYCETLTTPRDREDPSMN